MGSFFSRGTIIGLVTSLICLSTIDQLRHLVFQDQKDSVPIVSTLNDKTSPSSFLFISDTTPKDLSIPSILSTDVFHLNITAASRNLRKRVPVSRDFRDTMKAVSRPVTLSSSSSSLSLEKSISNKHIEYGTIRETNDTTKKSKTECKRLFGERRFYTLEEKKLPPMFYTFPGSGNTWGRLLIEYATGIYTGSVYNDKSLLNTLPGEFSCDWRVSVIKVHPHTHAFIPLRDGTFHSDDNKCKRGNVRQFKRAILLIRNPFDSIWSEFQRRVTQSHVDGILQQYFEWNRWQANAAQLSHEYFDMWNIHYMSIEKSFASQDILYVRYEDLKNSSKRIETLESIVKFLKMKVTKERLECAFISAESPRAHRAIDPDLEMTKDIAYTKPLACRMWKLFGKYCVMHGYTSWGSYDCDSEDFSPIPKINVGPRGEYDSKWVKSGQKLIDFGGYTSKGTKANGNDNNNNRGISGVDTITSLSINSENRIKTIHRLSPEIIESFHSKVTSMTLSESMSVMGVGKLGEDGPIWL